MARVRQLAELAFVNALHPMIVFANHPADSGDGIVEANKAAAAFLGYDADELLGKRMSDVLPDFTSSSITSAGIPADATPHSFRTKGGTRVTAHAQLSTFEAEGTTYVMCIVGLAAPASAENETEALRAILDHVPEGIIITDGAPDFRLKYASRHGLDMRGGSEAELIGVAAGNHQVCWGLFRADGETVPTPEEMPLYRAARLGLVTKDAEFMMERKSGEKIPVVVSAAPVRDAAGTIVGAINCWRDISVLKKLQSAVADSEERYRTLAAGTVEGVAVHADGRILFANDAFAAMFGYRPDEVVGKETVSFIAPEARDVAVRLATAGHDAPYESIGLRRDGSTFPVEFQGHTIIVNGRKKRIGLTRDLTRAKAAQRTLETTEERFRVAQELSLDAFTILKPVRDAAGIIVDFEWEYVNPQAGHLLKRNPEDLVGRRLLDILPGNSDSSDLFARYVQVVETGEAHEYEVHYADDGIDGWFRNMCVRLGDGIAVSFSDITHRKNAELELKAALEEAQTIRHTLETIMENVPVGITLATAPDVTIRYVSRYGRELTGRGRGDIEGIPVDLHSDRWHIFRADGVTPATNEELPLTRATQKGEFVREEVFFLQNEKGERFPILCTAAPVTADDGTITGGVIAWQEITEQKNFEEKLREVVAKRTAELHEKEELLQTILETLPVGIAVFDADGAMTYFNSAFRSIWESPVRAGVDEFTEKYPMFHLGTDHRLRLEEYPSRRAISTRRPVQGITIEVRTPSGRRKTIRTSAAPMYFPAGLGAITVIEDITEQQELQKQLLHAQKLESVGALAGGVAHDFNNLLMGIAGFTEIVCHDLEDTNQRGMLMHVLEAAEKGRELAQKLLVFSRQHVAETKILDLTELVETVVKFVAGLLGENVVVKSMLHFGPLPLRGNATQIDQVIMNLILNARDALPDGGTITVATGKETIDETTALRLELKAGEPYVYLSITDTGTGITADIIERIFDPYFTTKPAGKGTGLGLSIVHGIVRQHAGSIAVTSMAGKGATFTVYFPAVLDEKRSSRERKTLPPGGGETILVVEDDMTVAGFLSMALSLAGYSVVTAENAVQALDKLQHGKVDVVLTDVMMPGKNGMVMFEEMRELYPDLRVIFASGYSSDIMNRSSLDVAHYRFLQKPISRQTLLETVREVLDEPTTGSSL